VGGVINLRNILTDRWSAPAWYWLLVALVLSFQPGRVIGELALVVLGAWAIRDAK
jgi:hypothetical protein